MEGPQIGHRVLLSTKVQTRTVVTITSKDITVSGLDEAGEKDPVGSFEVRTMWLKNNGFTR